MHIMMRRFIISSFTQPTPQRRPTRFSTHHKGAGAHHPIRDGGSGLQSTGLIEHYSRSHNLSLALSVCICLCLRLSIPLFLPPSLPRSLSPVHPTVPFPLPSPTLPPSLTRCDERTHTHTPLKMQNRLPKVSAAGGPGPDRQRRSFAPLTPPRANRTPRRRELTPVARRPAG